MKRVLTHILNVTPAQRRRVVRSTTDLIGAVALGFLLCLGVLAAIALVVIAGFLLTH